MPDTETLSLADLGRLVSEVFLHHGMTPQDASDVADVLVWAEASGHRSHGILRVGRYVDFITRGDLLPQARPRLDRDVGALFRIDGARSAGAVAMRMARDVAAERAAEHGIALGLVADTTHIGAAGYHAARLAGPDRIAIVAASGVPLMAYHGAATKSLSTAPLAIAVPATGRPALLLDMASSQVALGKIKKALRDGQVLPEGWALTADGAPATDPAEAHVLLPMAGPKGSGLALMIECLTSILAGAPALLGRIEGTASGHTQNVMLIVVEIGRICDAAQFRNEVDALATALEAQPRTSGVDRILMPGARSARSRAIAEAQGVTIPAKDFAELRRLARVG